MRTRHAIGLMAAIMLMGCSAMGIGAPAGRRTAGDAGRRPAPRSRRSTRPPARSAARRRRRHHVHRHRRARGAQPRAGRGRRPGARSTSTSRWPPAWPTRRTPASRRPPCRRGARAGRAEPGALAVTSESMVVTLISYDATPASPPSARRTASPAAPWCRRTCVPSRSPAARARACW